jgi:hypothetical protein
MFGVGVGVRVGGFTASSGGGFDPDAQAFFDRVTTAGGSLTTTEKDATNTLVVSMKADGVWSSMKAIYPMVGASAAACAQNLKSSSFTGSFTSGWTFTSTGVTPNGTSAYFDTTLNSFTNLTQTSISFGIYYRSNAVAVPIEGTFDGDSLSISTRGTQTYFSIGTFTTIGPIIESTVGFKAVSRNASNLKSYINATQNGTATNSANCPSLAMYLGALNFNGAPGFYSSNEEAFAFIGDGLNDTNMSNYYTAIQAFQTTLSRQV